MSMMNSQARAQGAQGPPPSKVSPVSGAGASAALSPCVNFIPRVNSGSYETLDISKVLPNLCSCIALGGGGETNPQVPQLSGIPPGGPEPIPSGQNSALSIFTPGGECPIPNPPQSFGVRSYAPNTIRVGEAVGGTIQDSPHNPLTWSQRSVACPVDVHPLTW